MAQFTWPTVTVNANNASVGVNGDGAPLSSTQIGVVDSGGDLQPVTQGQATMAASIPVVIASNQSTLPVSAASLPLPSGAATSANQATQIGIETDIETNTATTATNTGTTATQVTSLNSKVVTCDTGDVTIAASALPAGAATEATLAQVDGGVQTISGQLPLTIGQKTMAASLAVAIASNQSAIPVAQSTPTAGTITQAAVSVGTSAVRCTVSAAAPNSARKVLMVTPISSSTAAFYIGSSSVTSSSTGRGIPVLPGQTFIANNDAGDYYIISDTASQTVFIMEQA